MHNYSPKNKYLLKNSTILAICQLLTKYLRNILRAGGADNLSQGRSKPHGLQGVLLQKMLSALPHHHSQKTVLC